LELVRLSTVHNSRRQRCLSPGLWEAIRSPSNHHSCCTVHRIEAKYAATHV
jgi:hypothetical protein